MTERSDNLADEYASAVKQQEIDEATRYFEGEAEAPEETQFAAPPAPPEEAEPGMSRAESAGGQFVQGAAQAVAAVPKAGAIAVKGAQRAASGENVEAVSAIGQEMAAIDAMIADPNTSDAERVALEGLRAKKAEQLQLNQTAVDVRDMPVEGSPLFREGERLEEAAAENFPTDPAFEGEFTQALARAGGNMVGMIAAAVAGGPVAGLASGVSLGAASQYEEATAAGADVETALQAAGLGGLIGTTEIIPIMRGIKPFKAISNRLVGALAKVFSATGEEAAQEAVQTVMENLTAQGLYDPERGALDNVGTAAMIGGILGGGMGTIGAAQTKGARTESEEAAARAFREAQQDENVEVSEDAIATAMGDDGDSLTIEAESADAAADQANAAREERRAFDAATQATENLLAATRAEIAELAPAATAEAGDLDVLADAIIGVESGGVADARNPRSTATGAGQFIEATWLDLIKTTRPDLAGQSREELLALRTDPAVSRQMVKAYAQQNGQALARAGLPVNNGTLYLAHFAGPQGAIKLLRASPETPAVDVLGADAVKANPFLRGKDAAWVTRWAAGKIGSPESARRRTGVLRAREARLAEAMAKATEDTEGQRTKRAAAETLNAALERLRAEDVDAILDAVGPRDGDVDPLDGVLDAVRAGRSLDEGMRKRPLGDVIKQAGGVDPSGPAAEELRAAGVTAQNSPGLFRKGGLTDLDTIVAEGNELFAGRPEMLAEDGTNVRPDVLIESLAAEASGQPFRSLAEQEAIAADPTEEMRRTLDDLGIDLDQVTNEEIKATLNELADEAARLRAMDEADVARPISEPAEGPAPGPAPDGEGGAAQAGGKVYINHARINTPDDVKALIQQVADRDAEAIDRKRRGVVSNEQTIDESSKEYQSIEDLLGRPPGPMTAAQAVAARNILTTSGEQLMRLARKARDPRATAEEKFAFRRALQVHYAIQSEVIAARTETARALQSWTIPSGSDRMRAQMLRELIDSSSGGMDPGRMADAMLTLEGDAARMNAFVKHTAGGRIGRALYEAWINGLLSSPKTHMVNIVSNSLTSLWAIPEKALEAGVSKVLYGGEVGVGEAVAQAYGLVSGIRDALKVAASGDVNSSPLGQQLAAFTKVEGQHERSIGPSALGVEPTSAFGRGIDYMGRAINVPTFMLGREDLFFKTLNYRAELHSLAYRQARSEGLRGDAMAERMADIVLNPPEALNAEALDAAHYRTFTNPLGDMGRRFQRMRSVVPGLKIIVPFVRTPVNIMKYTLQRTPLALASASIREDIAAGGPRGAQAVARITTGSMLMMAVTQMAAEGMVTGGGPEDRQTLDNWRRLGRQPYSIRIGDRWYAYNRLDPIGMLMGIGADIAEIGADANREDSEEMVTAGVVALANNLASKTYMSGVYDFIAAVDPHNPTSDPAKYLERLAGTLAPFSSFQRNVTAVVDPIYRDTRVTGGDERVLNYLDSIRRRFMTTVPGYSDDLPPRRDLWGEPISRESGVGWGYDFISPMYSRRESKDPVDVAMFENEVDVGRPQRSIRGVTLTSEEYSEFARVAGETAKEQLDRIVSTREFERLPGGPQSLKSELMKDVILRARDAARNRMMLENPALLTRIRAAQQEHMEKMLEQ